MYFQVPLQLPVLCVQNAVAGVGGNALIAMYFQVPLQLPVLCVQDAVAGVGSKALLAMYCQVPVLCRMLLLLLAVMHCLPCTTRSLSNYQSCVFRILLLLLEAGVVAAYHAL